MKKLFCFLFCLIAINAFAQTFKKEQPFAHTFSIIARDELTGEMGIGVESHWFSVGTAVPWAEAGVGAVATQSFVDKSYGIKALELIKKGKSAKEALDELTAQDSGRDVRQVAIIDKNGNVAAHTGKLCIKYATHITGKNFSVQSNMMLNSNVCEMMKLAFENSTGKPLAERILLALEAAQKAGGDIRGMQSAAILIVPGKSSGKLWNDKLVDIRVDDHVQPLKELRRLYNVHLAYEHMNNGDLAVEKNDMQLAMKEYGAAMRLFPSNLEMKYWTAVTLANNKQMPKAIPMFKTIFQKNKNWKELTRRLKPIGLIKVSDTDLQKILNL